MGRLLAIACVACAWTVNPVVAAAHSPDSPAVNTVLASSLRGPTGIRQLTPEERVQRLAEGLARMAVFVGGALLVTWLIVRSKEKKFQSAMLQAGYPPAEACKPLKPSWRWYLLSVLIFMAGLYACGFISIAAFRAMVEEGGDSASVSSLALVSAAILGVSLVAATVLIISVARARDRTKKQLLASPPGLVILDPPATVAAEEQKTG